MGTAEGEARSGAQAGEETPDWEELQSGLLPTLAALPDGLVITDEQERIAFASDGFLTLSGCSRQHCLGRALREVVPGGLTPGEGLAGRRQALEAAGRWIGRLVHRRPNGTLWWAEWTVVRMRAQGQGRGGYVGMARDMTPAYRAWGDRLTAAVAALAEWHQPDLAGHLVRTGQRMALLTRAWHEAYGREELDVNPEEAGLAARLHDIGKLDVPARVLRKPGALTPQEWRLIRRHPQAGRERLQALCTRWTADARSDYLEPLLALAAEIAWTHHERWDGSGYPRQLAGEDIPLAGRIFAVVDVYDALLSPRAYKPAWPEAEARRFLVAERERMFDPRAVAMLLDIADTPAWQAVDTLSA